MRILIAGTLVFLTCSFSLGVGAQDVPLPRMRPDPEPPASPSPPLPRPRPPPDVPAPPVLGTPAEEDDASEAESGSLQGLPKEPPRIYQTACPAVIDGTVVAEMLPPIDEGVCQVRSPYLVRAITISGREVVLSAPTITTCGMAGQFAEWAARFDAYTDVMFKSELATILTGTGFNCRPRNNQAGADMSEHGFANALDITGFILEDGTRVSLPEDWQDDDMEADAMRYAHDAACGLFTTVLGPEANALHADPSAS